MDTPELAPSFLTAGREYVDTLLRLGMDIEIACWAYDKALNRFVLIMLTDFFDVKGPLEISKVLFRAYNSSVTPKEIDPFSVRLHSTGHPFAKEIRLWGPGTYVQKVDEVTRKPYGPKTDVRGGTSQGIQFDIDWLIRSSKPVRRKNVEVSRRWSRFVRNVDKEAA